MSIANSPNLDNNDLEDDDQRILLPRPKPSRLQSSEAVSSNEPLVPHNIFVSYLSKDFPGNEVKSGSLVLDQDKDESDISIECPSKSDKYIRDNCKFKSILTPNCSS